jgi:cell division protein FtsX
MNNNDMQHTINKHEERIAELEKNQIRAEERHANLVEKLESLVSVGKWATLSCISVMVTIFIFVIEQNLK